MTLLPTPRVKFPEMYPQRQTNPTSNSWAQSAQDKKAQVPVMTQPSMHENSWAQEVAAVAAKEKAAEKAAATAKSTMSINLTKYEDKPMPPIPGEQAEEKGSQITMSKVRRDKIVPATPFFPSHHGSNVSDKDKKRSVTEPVAKTSQSVGAKVSLKNIRAKLTGGESTKSGEGGTPKTQVTYEPNEPTPSQKTEKAARVLGVYPKPKDQFQSIPNPPASAPATTESYYKSGDSVHNGQDAKSGPRRNAASTPVPLYSQPTARYLEENQPKGLAIVVEKTQKVPKMKPTINVNDKAEAIIFGDGMLSPTKVGNYGFRREVQTREVEAFARVASHAVIVENAAENSDEPDTMKSVDRPLTGSSTLTNPYSRMFESGGEMLQPVKYSPNSYEGIWENDPKVGYSLPPFSPTASGPLPMPGQAYTPTVSVAPDGKQESRGPNTEKSSNVQIVFKGDPSEISPQHMNAASYGSNNSFAPSSVYTSSANSGPSATPRPLALPVSHFVETPATVGPASIETRVNNGFGQSVPAPPASFPGFQPAAGPDLTHFGMTLHHHIETSFDRLGKLVVSKHDSLGDEIVKRSEHIEERVHKTSRGISRPDMNHLQKEFDVMKHEITVNAIAMTELKHMVSELTEKMTLIQKQLVGVPNKHAANQAGTLGSGMGIQEAEQKDTHVHTPTHRSTGFSRHRTQGRRHTNQPAPINTTGTGQAVRGTYHGRRSNAGSTFAPRRGSDNISGSSEHYNSINQSNSADMPLDLRGHPAFQHQAPFVYDDGTEPPMDGTHPLVYQGPNGNMYEMPSFGHSSWYDQVSQNYI